MATQQPKKPAAWYALDNLHHDGVVYGPGDAVPTLTEAQADYLRSQGIVSAVPPLPDDTDDTEDQPQG